MSLEKALAAKDEAKKLDALLAAWRKKKHPRIADLIDRVSEPLVQAAGGAVKAKSVPERTKLVLSMLRKPNATDVGRVLATEWPGTWDPAMPVVRALCKLPEDPRVAQCFARAVDLTQYVSESAIALYRLVFRRIDQLADVRTRELLERQLTRTKNEYYSRNSRTLEERSVAAIQKFKTPLLTASEEKLLAQLEAPFATASATTKERGKSGAELLDAVYANPSDLGLRAVYGDWLTQHGDPRGELINLQLAPLTPKSESRIRSLIKQHWREWVGPLADWFTFGSSRGAHPPEFKLGFAVSTLVQAPKYDVEEALKKLLDHREWRTVETLVSWPTHILPIHHALAHPNFAQVRELKFTLQHSDLAPLLETDAGAKLESVDLWLTEKDGPVPLEKLKNVKRLVAHAEGLKFVRALLPQLEVLRVERGKLDAAGWKLLEASGVARVEYDNVFVSREKGTAHFTTLERKVAVPTKEEEVALEALPKLKLAARKGPPLLSFDVKAPLRSDALVETTWNVLTTGFGVTFDALDIGGVEHDLTKDPVKRIQVRSRNQKNYYVRLSLRGQPGETVLLWKDKAEFVIAVRDVEKFLAALGALLALVPKETVVEAGLDGKPAAGAAGAWTRVEKFIRAL